jgi:WD40 repeat protein
LVTAVGVTADGKLAVSASGDRTLKVWDLRTGTTQTAFVAESSLTCCDVDPAGDTLVAGDKEGGVHLLRVEGIGLMMSRP